AKHHRLSRSRRFAYEHARNLRVVGAQELRRVGVLDGDGADAAAAASDTQLSGCAGMQTLDPGRTRTSGDDVVGTVERHREHQHSLHRICPSVTYEHLLRASDAEARARKSDYESLQWLPEAVSVDHDCSISSAKVGTGAAYGSDDRGRPHLVGNAMSISTT